MAEPSEPLPRTLTHPLHGDGPAKPLSLADRRAMIGRAMAASREGGDHGRGPGRSRRWAPAFILAAALVLGGGAALAMHLGADTGGGLERPGDRAERQPQEQAPPPSPSSSPPPEPAIAEPAPAPEEVGEATRPTDRRAPPAPPRRPSSASDGLAEANALRAEGRYDRAADAYLSVIDRHPASDQAYVARVAAADILLDHQRDAAQALALYEAAVEQRPGGNLEGQALYGAARAHRALGRDQAEQRTLRAFVERHPDSLRAAQAHRRLEDLRSE